jgi:ribose 5-phosphate isomerase B
MAEFKAPRKGRIVLGSDHAGFALKGRIGELLRERGVAYEDIGATSQEPTDYVDFALTVAERSPLGKPTSAF